MRPWYLGNTTIRSAFRLRDGLVALAESNLVGKLGGRDNENAFARVLDASEVANITRDSSDVSDLGRKWRSALSKLGFIVPQLPPKCKISQTAIGQPFTITANGRRLIEAQSVPGIQECFLRALAAYRIPSEIERQYDYSPFSPLRHTLAVMLELERVAGSSLIHQLEMALVLQLTSEEDGSRAVAERILDFRSQREAASHKKRFDDAAIERAATKHEYVAGTFRDYADTNFRYLRATGLVHSRGRGIDLVAEKHLLVERLVSNRHQPTAEQQLIELCAGARLPTDDQQSAMAILSELGSELRRRNISFVLEGRRLNTPGDIAVVRHEAEALLQNAKEEDFARRQIDSASEISSYLELIETRSYRATLHDGGEISIPRGEAAAYFEWIVWRAFLAIDSLVNPPYLARRFKIDQDFLPVSAAPGNGPDLIFEFEDFVLVVEVTLTSNSRQEAMEGETVRRHVAQAAVQQHGNGAKPVFGLFIANQIDTNTVETFRAGTWYDGGNKMALNIVPLTVRQFLSIFIPLTKGQKPDVRVLWQVMAKCSERRRNHSEAPSWRDDIGAVVAETLGSLH